jgi:hypothetical protein
MGSRAATPALPASSARAVARYLVGLRPALAEACAARGEWVGQLGALVAALRPDDRARAAGLAGELGRAFEQRFERAAERLDRLAPPPECGRCHAAVRAWVTALLGSCRALADVGRSGRLDGLRAAQAGLADAREEAGRFNDEHARLQEALRRRVRSVRRRHDRLPTSDQVAPS